MTVKNSAIDREAKTITIECEFDAPVARVWQLWSNPRELELWWGPPGWPATYVDHDLSVGGVMTYYMTGPDGTKSAGWWKVTEVDEPNRIVFDDGFGDSPETANPDLPVMQMVMTLSDLGDGRTGMVVRTQFPSLEALEQVAAMGMEEGMKLALGQIDALLGA